MAFIDGYLAAVPAAKKDEFLLHAKIAAQVFMDCGAIRVMENWGSDVPDGELTSFPLAVKRQADEVVVFSWIEWPSKAVRDEGMPKVMADPRMHPDQCPMPFDGKRVVFGGFENILQVK